MSGPGEAGSVSLAVSGADPAGEAVAGPRKTVPIPRSLPELQQLASRELRFDGRMRFYKNGKEMHHPLAVADLKDGDVVTVRLPSSRGAYATGSEKTLSTAQADFVRHPPVKHVEKVFSDNTSTLTEETRKAKVDYRSSYASDFIVHARTPRQVLPGQALYGTHFLSHAGEAEQKSTYAAHFIKHDIPPADSAGSDEKSALSEAARGHPFEGVTSYKEDYSRRVGDRVTAAKSVGSDYASTLTEQTAKCKFDGSTNYADDFIVHDLSCRMPSARPGQSAAFSGTSFAGVSEYRGKYNEYDRKVARVHLQLS